MCRILIMITIYMVGSSDTFKPLCDDIDTVACHAMFDQQPEFCHTNDAARYLCKRFCDFCPVECYHCDTAVQHYHLCNTTKLCAAGEVCLKKELTSYFDGHKEFEFKCADPFMCDGGGLLIGRKREITHVVSRGLSLSCCADDRCNYPQPTTTTSTKLSTSTTTTVKSTTTTVTTLAPVTTARVCPKDIIFVIEKTAEYKELIRLLKALIDRLDIGMSANLVSFLEIDNRHLRKIMDLDDFVIKSELLHSLETELHHLNDTNHAHAPPLHPGDSIQHIINEIVDKGTISHIGDRPNVNDVVVFILHESSLSNNHEQPKGALDSSLADISSDVITLLLGHVSAASISAAQDIATDARHILTLNHLHDYSRILGTLLQLIQQC